MKSLNDYKKNIDLPKFILDNYPYKLDKESTKASPKIRSNDGSEFITFKYYSDSGWKFFNKSTSEKGSIIDFVQKEENITNLGQVRGIIDRLSGGSFSPLSQTPSHSNTVDVKAIRHYFTEQQAAEKSPYRFKLGELKDTSYLSSRNIDAAMLAHDKFKGTAYNSYFRNADTGSSFVNTTFPIFSKNELRFDKRSDDTERRVVALQTYYRNSDGSNGKRFVGSRGEGVWRSNIDPQQQVDKIFLTEQPIDSYSHAQMNPKLLEGNNGYYAFFGQISKSQLKNTLEDLNNGLFHDSAEGNFYNKPREVIFAFDNDAAGQRYALQFLNGLDTDYYGKPNKSSEYLLNSDFEPTMWKKVRDEKVFDAQVKVSFICSSEAEGKKYINTFKEHFKAHKLGTCSDSSVKFSWGEDGFKDGKAFISLDFKNKPESWSVINDFVHTYKLSKSNMLKFEKSRCKDWNEDLSLARSGGADKKKSSRAELNEGRVFSSEKTDGISL